MRIVTSVAIACTFVAAMAARSVAQSEARDTTLGIARVSGIVADSATGEIMPCIDVSVEDSAGHRLVRARTDLRGAFQLRVTVPMGASMRLRFDATPAPPVYGPWLRMIADSLDIRVYRVAFPTTVVDDGNSVVDGPDVEPRQIPGFGAPRYPDELRRSRTSGDVMMLFAIDASGRVVLSTARVLSTSHPLFAEAMMKALPNMRFRPARRDNQPVCAFVRYPAGFFIGR